MEKRLINRYVNLITLAPTHSGKGEIIKQEYKYVKFDIFVSYSTFTCVKMLPKEDKHTFGVRV
jgi:hypothetical protein